MKNLSIVSWVCLAMIGLSCSSVRQADSGVGQAESLELSELEDQFSTGLDGVVRCMASEGFEYYPEEVSAADDAAADLLSLELAAASSAKERAETAGYGIVGSIRDVGRGLELDQSANRNDRYEVSLQMDERQKYNERLSGANSEAQIGCIDLKQASADESEVEFASKMSTLFDAAVTESALLELEQDWSRCMANEGFNGLATGNDAERLALDKIGATLGDYSETLEVSDGAGWLASSDGSSIPEPLLEESLEIEVEIASAEATCRKVSVLEPVIELIVDYNMENNVVDQVRLDELLGAGSL